jgi:5-methylcytosine-specific restriction endonuclease McrA
MRAPRAGLVWSKGRFVRRACYGAWMASAEWRRTREAWLAAHLTGYGRPPTCAVCGSEWTLRRGDLHHRSYDRIGHERFADLVPLCRGCHDLLHLVLESIPAWRRLGRARATDLIVAMLARSVADPGASGPADG